MGTGRDDTSTPLFSFRHVCLSGRQGRLRLRDIDLDLPDHAVTVIVGASGSGKSSLLRLCNRLEAPDSGSVSFRGDDLAGLDPLALRREVGMLFQRPVTFPGTCRDNLLEAAPEADDEAMVHWLEQADLDRRYLDRVADELSGGQSQRLCLARALATEPDVLLADEATSALDRTATGVIEDLVVQLAGTGIPVIWVTHDLDQARRLATYEVVIHDGTVAHAGPADRVDAKIGADLAALLDADAEATAQRAGGPADHGNDRRDARTGSADDSSGLSTDATDATAHRNDRDDTPQATTGDAIGHDRPPNETAPGDAIGHDRPPNETAPGGHGHDRPPRDAADDGNDRNGHDDR